MSFSTQTSAWCNAPSEAEAKSTLKLYVSMWRVILLTRGPKPSMLRSLRRVTTPTTLNSLAPPLVVCSHRPSGDPTGRYLVGGSARATWLRARLSLACGRCSRRLFNRSSLRTVVCLSLTANLRLADVLGNVVVPATLPGLPRDSVAVVLQPLTVDKADLLERVSLLPRATLDLILSGIEIVLQEMRCVRPTRQRGTRASARFQGGRLTAGQREPAVTQLL